MADSATLRFAGGGSGRSAATITKNGVWMRPLFYPADSKQATSQRPKANTAKMAMNHIIITILVADLAL